MRYLIMCRSLTAAQQCRDQLMGQGIPAQVTKAPGDLRKNGCGYAVSIYKSVERAVRLLSDKNMLTGRVYFEDANGEYKEWRHDLS